MMQSRSVHIDTEVFTQLWNDGVSRADIAARFGCGTASVTRWSVLLGLEPRPRGIHPGQVRRTSPVIAKPAPEPTYHPGLSAAVKRAGASVQALGKVATSYRVPYRDVLAMAGVAG